MSDIVWAINPQRDHLRDLVHRMRRFAADTLTARNIEFALDLPSENLETKIEGNPRREVFRIFKEALNNIVRHSGCTRAQIAMQLHGGHSLFLTLRDNGKGFDINRESEGHGLSSMRSRAEALGPIYRRSTAGEGTGIELHAPISVAAHAAAT